MPDIMEHNIFFALSNVQAALQVPKDAVNTDKDFRYRTAEGILRIVKPLCRANGITLSLTERVENIGGHNYIIATAAATLIADPSQKVEASTPVREAMDRPDLDPCQRSGGAVSYARKYALCGLLAIDDGRADPDAGGRHGGNKDMESTMAPQESAEATAFATMICFDCGQPIKTVVSNGKTYDSQALAAKSTKVYKHPLCAKCYVARHKAEKAQEETA